MPGGSGFPSGCKPYGLEAGLEATTMFHSSPTEFIAVKNRSHNQLNLIQVPQ
jgi:hypothetical protein